MKGILTGFIAMLTVAALPVLSAQTVITVKADVWNPFNGDPKTEYLGYGIEILKAVFEKQGYKIDYQVTPWTRSLQDLEAGKTTAVIGAAKVDCPEAVFPEEEMAKVVNSFYVKKGNTWKYSGVDSLKSVKLASISEYTYAPDVDAYIEAGKEPSVQIATGEDALVKNIKKLQAGRIDTLIESPQVFAWKLKELKLPASDFEDAGNTGYTQLLYVAFSKVDPNAKKYADVYSKGIQELRKSGELAKILEKYNVKDWK